MNFSDFGENFGSQQAGQSPYRGAAHERLRRSEMRFRAFCKVGFAAVADGDEHIAQEAGMTEPLDRSAGEPRAKPRVVEARQFGERRIDKIGFGLEFGFPRRAGEFVPGQTARQSSQPKMRLPTLSRNSCGIGPRCSIVR